MPGWLNEPECLARLIETILNQILQAQMTEHLGANPYERSPERQGDRNGTRPRTLYTRVGPVTLQAPQTRDGSFSPEIFKRDQRSEQAFVLALMERVVQGVSTRKVTEITEALCGTSFSKSTVSALCAQLEPRIRAFTERPLTASYPFVLVDALGLTVREDDRVVPKAALIATGIRDDGGREILGLAIGDSESFAAWEDFFKGLKGHGLRGVLWVISDSHAGLVEAARKPFQGVSWQRCRVHLLRNLLGHTPSRPRAEGAAHAKRIFQPPDLEEARRQLAAFVTRFETIAPKAALCLEEGFEDAVSVMGLPEKDRRRLRTTNMQERLNEEIRRRERVIRIFPNIESAHRLVGSLLVEQHGTWAEQCDLNREEFHEWLASRQPAGPPSEKVVSLMS